MSETEQSEKKHTPTEVLIRAMEHAEEMSQCMVIFRLSKNENGLDGMGWVTEFATLPEKLAFMEEAKMAMFHNNYKEDR